MQKPNPSLRLVRRRPRTYVPLADVVWVEGDGAYSIIHLTGGQSVRVAISLAYMARRLPELVRCRRDSLINLTHVRVMPRHQNVLVLITGQRIPLARRRKEYIRQLFLASQHETPTFPGQ